MHSGAASPPAADPLLSDAHLQAWFHCALAALAEAAAGRAPDATAARAADALAALALGPDGDAERSTPRHPRGYEWALARRVRRAPPPPPAVRAQPLPPPPPPARPHHTAGDVPLPTDALTMRDVVEAAAAERGLALLPHPRALRVAGCEVLLLARDAPVAALYLQNGVAFLHAADAPAAALPKPLRPLVRHDAAPGAAAGGASWLPLSLQRLLDAVEQAAA